MPDPARPAVAAGLLMFSLVGHSAWGGAIQSNKTATGTGGMPTAAAPGVANPAPSLPDPADTTLSNAGGSAISSPWSLALKLAATGADPNTPGTGTQRGFRFQYRPVGVAPIPVTTEREPASESKELTSGSIPTTTATPLPGPSTTPTERAPRPGSPDLALSHSGSGGSEIATAPVPASGPTVRPTAPGTPVPAVASPAATIPMTLSTTSRAGGTSPVAASAIDSARAVSNTSSAAPAADAYVNLSSGPFPDSSNLATGDPKSWTTSPVVTRLFGGSVPSAQDQAAFQSKVASTVTDSYKQAGIPIRVTTDPTVPAAHTISVVSGAQATDVPQALGLTNVGYNGFTFIDQFTPAQNVSDLATAVGHNVAHELMHAFGVADHPDTSGSAIDAAATSWANLTDPKASFSEQASHLISTLDLDAAGTTIAANNNGAPNRDGAQQLDSVPVPEPGAVLIWAGAVVAVAVARRRFR